MISSNQKHWEQLVELVKLVKRAEQQFLGPRPRAQAYKRGRERFIQRGHAVLRWSKKGIKFKTLISRDHGIYREQTHPVCAVLRLPNSPLLLTLIFSADSCLLVRDRTHASDSLMTPSATL